VLNPSDRMKMPLLGLTQTNATSGYKVSGAEHHHPAQQENGPGGVDAFAAALLDARRRLVPDEQCSLDSSPINTKQSIPGSLSGCPSCGSGGV
jgi:hypothetical protein